MARHEVLVRVLSLCLHGASSVGGADAGGARYLLRLEPGGRELTGKWRDGAGGSFPLLRNGIFAPPPLCGFAGSAKLCCVSLSNFPH